MAYGKIVASIDGKLSLKLRLLIFFCTNAENAELTVTETAKKFDSAANTCRIALQELAEEGILQNRMAGDADKVHKNTIIYSAGPILLEELGVISEPIIAK